MATPKDCRNIEPSTKLLQLTSITWQGCTGNKCKGGGEGTSAVANAGTSLRKTKNCCVLC